MAEDEKRLFVEVERLLAESRDKLGNKGSVRLRVLIDMSLLEVGKTLAPDTRKRPSKP